MKALPLVISLGFSILLLGCATVPPPPASPPPPPPPPIQASESCDQPPTPDGTDISVDAQGNMTPDLQTIVLSRSAGNEVTWTLNRTGDLLIDTKGARGVKKAKPQKEKEKLSADRDGDECYSIKYDIVIDGKVAKDPIIIIRP